MSSLTLESIEPYYNDIANKKEYIFTFDSPLTDDLIASELFHANPNAIRDSLENYMRSSIQYQLSSIGINFFYDTFMEDFYRRGKGWKVTTFDGSEKITPDSLKITTSVDVENIVG